MAEVNTAEKEAAADAAFAPSVVVTPPAAAEKVVETPKAEAEPKAAAAKPDLPVKPPEKPEYTRVLKKDWDTLQATAGNFKAASGKVAQLESALVKLTGSLGNPEQFEQRIVEKIRAQTPLGLSVELSDEDFADMAAEFPELAKLTRSSLEKAFKKAGVKGTGQASAPQGVDVGKEVQKALLERDKQLFEEEYPTWPEIVGRPPAEGGEAVQTDYRKWLATQPAEYQKKINETDSYREIHKSIDKFHASQTTAPQQTPAKQPDRAAARRSIVEDAATPRLEGGAPLPKQSMSAEEAFRTASR